MFIRKYKKKYGVEVWAEHVATKKKKKLWRKKDDLLGKCLFDVLFLLQQSFNFKKKKYIEYPYKEN